MGPHEMGDGGRDSVCGELGGGGELNIFFRGRNAHQESHTQRFSIILRNYKCSSRGKMVFKCKDFEMNGDPLSRDYSCLLEGGVFGPEKCKIRK